MKGCLKIEMDKDCLTCPEISLVTEKLTYDDFDGNQVICNTHHCKHSEFCKRVKSNWEQQNVAET